MVIYCLGISHNTAGLSLREHLSFSPHQLDAALARLGCGLEARWGDLGECAILSTCSRFEIYCVSGKPVFETLEAFLAEIHGFPPGEISAAAYRLVDDAAIAHLLRVAAGLDSIVLGEPQILGQVTDAYSAARRHGTTGKILSRLFQAAIRAGKRTRTETAIGHNPTSISSLAVSLIANTIPNLKSARILVIGAGEMAELAVEALRKRGVTGITVANRTLARAEALAKRWNGHAASLEGLPALLREADAVITSTSAPHTILSKSLLESAMKSRPESPLLLLDIAVPRDVDVDVDELSNVKRYDLDTLNYRLRNSLARRSSEIPAVETILAEEQAAFREYLSTLNVVPIIAGMRGQANAIREAELEKAIRKLPELPPETLEQLDLLTRAIVKKILHKPTARLREVSSGSNAADYADVTRSLFGLD